MFRLYRFGAVLPQYTAAIKRMAEHISGQTPVVVAAEACFYLETNRDLDERESQIVRWLLTETFEPDGLADTTYLMGQPTVIEIGPRLNFETAWSSTAVSICQLNEVHAVTRIERSRRFGLDISLTEDQRRLLVEPLHDRMTEAAYLDPVESFKSGVRPEPVRVIALLEEGIEALRRINKERGLAMDDHDLEQFFELFVGQLRRNPTDVELFQLGQGNSEHSRHGFFKGRLTIDGVTHASSLMQIVKEPWKRNPNNSLIAFHDDSSAIRGGLVRDFVPQRPGARPSPMMLDERVYHPTLTAETHNFPCGVAPYPGAATGGGGRIRDNLAVGRGGMVIASGAAYCVGNLHIADPCEDSGKGRAHPANLSSPLAILIEASNGASDYGNCFGEPLIYGFVRSFGMQTPGGYRSWFKPIMYSVGVGQIDDRHVHKGAPRAGMLVVQIGGPAYRIGMGGGAASSVLSGENVADLDFDAVQRGNPEMGQRMARVMRACLELGDENPIVSAHDLGAGGDSNALPEIAYPAGARIDLRAIPVGDKTMSVLEIWGNEAQERNAVLVRPEDLDRVLAIGRRERAPIAVVGEITGDGRLVLHDEIGRSNPVDLPLERVLGDVPPKELFLETIREQLIPLDLGGISVNKGLEAVLRLPSVGSKSYLTRKVDRCVTGHVAQQQCVGPNHLPLSDFAIVGQSLFDVRGVASSLGEHAIKGLIDSAAMARMAVAEALLNMVGARITHIDDIRCSANWMWAAKLPGEGAAMHRAAVAMSALMIELGIAVDGGKDSLSMATVDQRGDKIKAPGELVIAAYAPMPDVGVKVTPDLKTPGNALILIDLSGGRSRLGGSALAQTLGQIGDESPDVSDAALLSRAFIAVQDLVGNRLVVSAHDRSDGGLITTICEMAFGGNTGVDVDLQSQCDALAACFAEELGVVVEAPDGEAVLKFLGERNVPAIVLGTVTEPGGNIVIRHWETQGGSTGGFANETGDVTVVIDRPMVELRALWDDTSIRLERLQMNPICADEEALNTRTLTNKPNWYLTFTPMATPAEQLRALPSDKPKVAVVRDQGSNGDRELAASFHAAGFEVWDLTMTDLIDGRITLDQFRGLAFPGGFSYGDVLDAGKAWAGIIRFHPELAAQFDRFYERPDVFSIGVCNGAQLVTVAGWVPQREIGSSGGGQDRNQPRFIRNSSGRFECRFVTVEITPSPSLFFRGMEGSHIGVWVAHGEGRLHVPAGVDSLDSSAVAMRYVDPDGKPTEAYPFNPNGSPGGITGLTSVDGRHLAIMPHPERLTNQLWQWPWMPDEWKDLEVSPWLKIFQNAYDWCAAC